MALEIQALEGANGYLWTVKQQVVVCGAMGWRKITKIDRITDGRGGTIYIGKDAFDKYGRLRGGDTWSRTHIEPATEKVIEEIRDSIAISRLEKFHWNTLPGWMATSVIEFMSKDKRVDFKTGKFIPNPEG